MDSAWTPVQALSTTQTPAASGTTLHAFAERFRQDTQRTCRTSWVARKVIREMDSFLRTLANSALVVTEVGAAEAAAAAKKATSHH